MEKEELLIVKREREKLKFKVCEKNHNQWSPKKYEKIIASKDYNLLAYLFYDLNNMGYPIEKAYLKFKSLLNDPELFFLR
jgi:hypothetical protein